MKTFSLPDLGEGLDEVEILAWHAGAGDHIVADQPLVSVETAKAVVDIPAPHSGHIAECFGQPGDIVKVGDPLIAYRDEQPRDTATVVGEIPRAAAAPAPASITETAPGAQIQAAPAVRRRARELGIDLGRITPGGAHGEIRMEDLAAAVQPAEDQGSIRELRGPRRTMARNMTRAHAQVAPATLYDDADIDHWSGAADPTVRLVLAIAAGCAAAPALNAWLFADREQLQLHGRLDLGIAVATDQGLFVPVLRDAGHRDEADLRTGLERLKADVRARDIPPRELLGATFTLSNFGTLGGRHAALVVVPPQVAILGAGRIAPRPVVHAGRLCAHRTLPLSLTFDHRAVTGAEAAAFMAAVKHTLET